MTILIALAAAAVAAAQPAPPASLPAVRAGDSQLSCEALLAEANSLNAGVLAQQADAMAMASRMSQSATSLGGGAVAGTLAGMAASFVPGLSTVTSLAQAARIDAQQAMMMAQVERAQAQMTDMLPTYQRLEHLTGLIHHKGC